MVILDEEVGACITVKLGDRLRALQENASKWQHTSNRNELPENVSSLKERRKAFTKANDENKDFALQKPTSTTRNVPNNQQIPFQTIKFVAKKSLERQPVDDKSNLLLSLTTPKTSHRRFEENKPQHLPAANDATNNNDELVLRENNEQPQILKCREKNQPAMTDIENEKPEERPSHFLPTTKHRVTRPGRLPTRFQNAASSPMPTVSLNSELHLETEDKENQDKAVTLKRTIKVKSAVPFQLPIIGKEHCGVKLRSADRSAPYPEPMLIRALALGSSPTSSNGVVDLRLVQPIKQSLTDRGSYLLVTNKKMIIRHGKDATVQERAKIAQLAHEVVAGKEFFGYTGKPELANEDGVADAAFFRSLNESEQQEVTIDNFQQIYPNSFDVYRIEESGVSEKIACENISTMSFDSNQIYVLDFGSEIYTWLGRNCKRSLAHFASEQVEKLKSSPLSFEMSQFLCANQEEQRRPSWILVRRLSEGIAESLFRHKFALNSAPPKPAGIHFKSTDNQVSKLSSKFCANLRLKPTASKTHQLKDEDTLARELAAKFTQSTPVNEYFLELEDTQIYPFDPNVFTEQLNFLVLNGEHLESLEEQPKEFDCRKCYVIEWRYRVERPGVRKLNNEEAKKHDTGRERGVFFYWLGQNSTIKEQSFCALALRNLDKERLEHIRVEQGHEHPLLVSLFNEIGFIVSGTETQFFLFHSYGQDGNLLAMVEMRGYTGRSQTTMARIVDDQLICQRGEHCPQNVWDNAQKLARKFADTKHLNLECSEISDFECLKPSSWKQSPRFYRVYEHEGEELLQNRAYFTFPAHQSDFCDDGCILIENDGYLWMWSSGIISTFALKVGEYFWSVERKMDAETSAKVLTKGNEPSEFMALFPEWKEEESETNTVPVHSLAHLLKERTTTRSLQEVREKKLPEGCDLKRLEIYLADVDFESVFKMSKEEFAKLQEWKQIRLKKECGLF